LDVDLSGKNSLLNLNWFVSNEIQPFYDKINNWMSRKKPTRVIGIGRSKEVNQWCHPKNRNFLEIARIPGAFPVTYNDSADSKHYLSDSISIVLALNKESMLLDPIDWNAFKHDFREWTEHYVPEYVIPDWTDKLFQERESLTHESRSRRCDVPSCLGVYKFFDSRAVRRKEERYLIDRGIPAEIAMLIDRSNRHEKSLSMIGILPNQFRKILNCSTQNPIDAWNDISKTLFWSGYLVWKKRKALYQNFWTNIAPEEWKSHRKGQKKKRQQTLSSCGNPFHFLIKSKDLSKQRLTKCPCSKSTVHNTQSTTKDIRFYLGAPATHEYLTNTGSPLEDLFTNQSNFQTQQDKIRAQHNRGRKRKH